MRRKWPLAGGLAVLVLVAAVAWGWYWQRQKAEKAHAGVPVLRQTAAPREQPAEVSLPGKIQARNIVNVAAPVDGILDQYLVNVGEEVFEGEVLARIKNAGLDAAQQNARVDAERAEARIKDLEAQLIAARLELSRARSDSVRAKAAYEQLQKTYARQELLLQAGATPRLTFEKAEREYQNAKSDSAAFEAAEKAADDRVTSLSKEIESAKAMLDSKSKDLDTAEAQIAGGEVRSEVNGLVVARRGQAGDAVDQSMKDLLRIAVDLSALEVVVDADPRVTQEIRPGQPVSIRIAEAPSPIEGTIREVKSGQVFVDFTSPSAAIRPGLTAMVTIKLH